jgi:hypothetical protein
LALNKKNLEGSKNHCSLVFFFLLSRPPYPIVALQEMKLFARDPEPNKNRPSDDDDDDANNEQSDGRSNVDVSCAMQGYQNAETALDRVSV